MSGAVLALIAVLALGACGRYGPPTRRPAAEPPPESAHELGAEANDECEEGAESDER